VSVFARISTTKQKTGRIVAVDRVMGNVRFPSSRGNCGSGAAPLDQRIM
jgi:hypothetical protein